MSRHPTRRGSIAAIRAPLANIVELVWACQFPKDCNRENEYLSKLLPFFKQNEELFRNQDALWRNEGTRAVQAGYGLARF